MFTTLERRGPHQLGKSGGADQISIDNVRPDEFSKKSLKLLDKKLE
jgi:hypothetical protein